MEKRDYALDILKGFGIILVIAGHCQVPYLTHFAFSFHMPLFFFISGYLSKNTPANKQFAREAKRLLFPYLFSCTTIIILTFIIDFILKTNNVPSALLSSLTGSGAPRRFFNRDLCIGPLWFLLALFWIKLFYHIFCRFKISTYMQIALSVLFIPIANTSSIYITFPLSIQPAIGGYGFFIVGHCIKEANTKNIKKILPWSFFTWLYCLFFSNMDVNRCLYDSFYFIDLTGALGATLAFYSIVKKTYKPTNKFYHFFKWFGNFSIIAMSVHAVDQVLLVHTYHFWDTQHETISSTLIFSIRTLITIIPTYIIYKNSIIRNTVFQI